MQRATEDFVKYMKNPNTVRKTTSDLKKFYYTYMCCQFFIIDTIYKKLQIYDKKNKAWLILYISIRKHLYII